MVWEAASDWSKSYFSLSSHGGKRNLQESFFSLISGHVFVILIIFIISFVVITICASEGPHCHHHRPQHLHYHQRHCHQKISQQVWRWILFLFPEPWFRPSSCEYTHRSHSNYISLNWIHLKLEFAWEANLHLFTCAFWRWGAGAKKRKLHAMLQIQRRGRAAAFQNCVEKTEEEIIKIDTFRWIPPPCSVSCQRTLPTLS